MKILVITSHLPHRRSISGHQIVYQRIRRLMDAGHQVGLCSLRGTAEGTGNDPLYDQLSDLRVLPAPARASLARRVRDYTLSRIPPPYWPYHSPAMYRAVGDMVHEADYDVVLAEFSQMGQYLYENPWLPAVRTIISAHECASISTRTPLFLPQRTWARSVAEHLIQRDLRRFEFDLYRSVDRVLTLTRADKFTLQMYAPELRVSVVPPGVDHDYFSLEGVGSSESSIVFTGQFSDPANRDGIEWFLEHSWPKLRQLHPQLIFYVLGPNLPPHTYALARRHPGVRLPGEMADIRPYLAKAKAFVCPVRMGSGLKMKILEAMSAGVPVVTTSIGAEGIPVQSGVNAMLADEPQMLAEAVDLLISDPLFAKRMAEQAHRMVRERFNWDLSMKSLESVLRDVVKTGSASR